MRYQLIPVVLLLAVTACARDPNVGALDEAHLDRAHIEAVFETVQRMINSGDRTGVEQLFTEDGTYHNAALPEPIQGRVAIRTLSARWPQVDHRPEWVVIDGNRLVFGWTERQGDAPPYRGIGNYRFNEDGLITCYEGMFDPATLPAAAITGAVGVGC